LVYDTHSQNLIAPIFKVGDLRDCNVVLHLNINSKRESCPGIPAIYLVQPTEENFKLIAKDLV
jgi:sec1 family domain-containing protein 1